MEPVCAGGACTSDCGDGLVLDEECDDGNQIDGDGCSSTCEVEDGFTCEQEAMSETMEIPVIYKDFENYGSGGTNPDFNQQNIWDCVAATEGIVETELDTDGKPSLNPDYVSCEDTDSDTSTVPGPYCCGMTSTAENFSSWYDHSGVGDEVIVSTLVLWDNGDGNYINRWISDTGQRWYNPETEELVDGAATFFPIDGMGLVGAGEESPSFARIAPVYGGTTLWKTEQEVLTEAAADGYDPPEDYTYNDHNFFFTSEVRFWFEYTEAAAQELEFLGDDDVWVFIGGELALDVGGMHSAVGGTVDLTTLGLADGEYYEIAVFHAERQQESSSFKLTLSGFNTSASICTPGCGDGVVTAGEQCDDGVNDGGYGECGPKCLLAEHCGDGIVQPEYEDCDDGNYVSGDECPPSCRIIGIE